MSGRSIRRTFQAAIHSLLCVVGLVYAANCSAATLRIGLVTDPDGLDPAFARVWSTTIVLNSICDKLVDITPDYRYVPQLATEWSWSEDRRVLLLKLRAGVKFHDGEPFNAAAVKYTFERNLTIRGSSWVALHSAITGVEVIDDLTAKVTLSAPMSGPLFARLVISFGMIVSPKAAEANGEKFGAKPVCTGPYRFVERVPLTHITLEKFPDYWDKHRVHIDRIVYRIMPDSTVRLANLLAGSLDVIEQLPAVDGPRVERSALQDCSRHVSWAYAHLHQRWPK